MSGSEKPSDWIRDRAQELMPNGYGLGLNSRPGFEFTDAYVPWTKAIIEYLDSQQAVEIPLEERQEIADTLNGILERLDG